jgi:heavy metal translocating P-type ATPase
MIALVESADASKARIVRLADKWATWIVVIALASAAVTWMVTGEVRRAVTVLVVFCPCALVLATPTAIVAAIGNVARFGVLVREGDALERLAKVKLVTFDKTGTLTHGRPEVVAVETKVEQLLSCSASCDEQTKKCDTVAKQTRERSPFALYALVASAESMSEHPIGKAIVRGWSREESAALAEPACSLVAPVDFSMMPGRGVTAVVAGRRVVAGNLEMLKEQHVANIAALEQQAQRYRLRGRTTVFVGVDGEAAGLVAIADTVRQAARATIRGISDLNITPVLITGDNAEAAHAIAAEVGMSQVRAECLPEEKMEIIAAYEASGLPVCMVGDGINDAPALKRATVGIALGGVGSDIAASAADIVLVKDDIATLPHLLALSRRMMTSIKLNMSFSMALNFAAIILAMTAVLDPVTGALVHNVGSVIVIINSALLLRWKKRN